MKTALPKSISSIQEAKDFLKSLYYNGESFHPEDDPAEAGHYVNGLWLPLFTLEEGHTISILMAQVWNQFEGEKFDPCGYLLELGGYVTE